MTISGTLFGIFKGNSCFRIRKAESVYLLQMVIIAIMQLTLVG